MHLPTLQALEKGRLLVCGVKVQTDVQGSIGRYVLYIESGAVHRHEYAVTGRHIREVLLQPLYLFLAHISIVVTTLVVILVDDVVQHHEMVLPYVERVPQRPKLGYVLLLGLVIVGKGHVVVMVTNYVEGPHRKLLGHRLVAGHVQVLPVDVPGHVPQYDVIYRLVLCVRLFLQRRDIKLLESVDVLAVVAVRKVEVRGHYHPETVVGLLLEIEAYGVVRGRYRLPELRHGAVAFRHIPGGDGYEDISAFHLAVQPEVSVLVRRGYFISVRDHYVPESLSVAQNSSFHGGSLLVRYIRISRIVVVRFGAGQQSKGEDYGCSNTETHHF